MQAGSVECSLAAISVVPDACCSGDHCTECLIVTTTAYTRKITSFVKDVYPEGPMKIEVIGLEGDLESAEMLRAVKDRITVRRACIFVS